MDILWLSWLLGIDYGCHIFIAYIMVVIMVVIDTLYIITVMVTVYICNMVAIVTLHVLWLSLWLLS